MAALIPFPLLLLPLLLCPADASTSTATSTSTTAAPAPAPAPAAWLLQAEQTCLGFGTHTYASACVGNVAVACLGTMTVTEETGFVACFLGGTATEQCWAGPPKPEEHCIGFGISEERKMCIGVVGWTCRDSYFGFAGFMLCLVRRAAVKCFL